MYSDGIVEDHSQSFLCGESAGQRSEGEDVDRQQRIAIESDSEQSVILAAAKRGNSAIRVGPPLCNWHRVASPLQMFEYFLPSSRTGQRSPEFCTPILFTSLSAKISQSSSQIRETTHYISDYFVLKDRERELCHCCSPKSERNYHVFDSPASLRRRRMSHCGYQNP